MIHLSGVDASFLHLETPEMPMHVGSLHLMDLPEGYSGDFYQDVVQHISTRMHLAPVFERKLAQMPFEMSNPVWVDDDDIDLEYHIRRVVLSKPGTMRQLEQYVGRLHSSLLDRSRPLWETYVFEGLENGQVAIYSKVHHAAVDGQAGVALAKALFDAVPTGREIKPPRTRQRSNQYQLGFAELATAAMQNTMQQYIKLVTTLPNAMRALTSVSGPAFSNLMKLPSLSFGSMLQPNFGLDALRGANYGMPAGLGFGPRTPLNVSITNQRSFAGRSVSLSQTKAAAKKAGVSLNDMVMAACAGALRRYMRELNITLDRPMTAAIPVSLREAGNTDQNNQVTMMLASLATDIEDPLERLKAINSSTTASKELTGSFKAAIPTDFPSFGAPWIMTSLATLFGRSKLTDQLPPVANVAISNVPGVPVPLYIAGAKMTSYFPVSIPSHGCALNITVQSYNGSLDYGLTACRRTVPDVDDIANYIVAAHAELNKALDAVVVQPATATDAAQVKRAEPEPARVAAPRAHPSPLDAIPTQPAKPNETVLVLSGSVAKQAPARGKAKPKAAKASVKVPAKTKSRGSETPAQIAAREGLSHAKKAAPARGTKIPNVSVSTSARGARKTKKSKRAR